ncbi:uncharacterized protein Dwil_GK24429 [Drosophila willistoni]|uniref:Protein MIS12 homolog n=1 Tax=Drosophila willistoni TaxID=7260 RepID=B4N0R5_DROWI|nr:uncharacterized protein LOC6643911 [Drosophila willistoni]EDW77678.1 uncharacterized protein Dwil_GK24429 [Drosophila willistoni]
MDFDEHAYALEFFNFTPEQIAAERQHCVNSIVGKAIDATIKRIETPATALKLKEQKARVMRSIQERCVPKLDHLRVMDKQTFHVPPHVLQIQDFDLEHQFDVKDEQKKLAKLELLKTRFRENVAMLAQLKVEDDNYSAMEDIIRMETKMQQQIYAKLESLNCPKLIKFAQKVVDNEQQKEK